MAYRVMQTCETGEVFCAKSEFVTMDDAFFWIGKNAHLYPESGFFVEADSGYPYTTEDKDFEDIPW